MIAIPQFRMVSRRSVLPPELGLDLQFAADKTLTARVGPTPSYSRASDGTYFDSNGVLQTAGVNVPRFDHRLENGVWVSKGLLIEANSANKMARSEEFGNAYWTKVGGTITSDDVVAPDGSITADRFTEGAGSSQRYIGRQNNTGPGIYYTWSVFVKAVPGSAQRYVWVYTGSGGFGTAGYGVFNPNTGQVVASANVSSTFVQDCGNGWYRIGVTDLATAGVLDSNFNVYLSPSTSSLAAYTGDGASGVYFWGAHLEGAGGSLFPSSYIKTTTSEDVVRAADVCRITGTNFTNMWNPLAGTLYAGFSIQRQVVGSYSGGNPRVVYAQSTAGVGNYDHASFTLSTTATNGGVGSNGSDQAVFALTSPTVNVRSNVAMSFATNNFRACKDGGTVLSDLTGTMPDEINVMDIGYDSKVPDRYLNGHLAAIRYYTLNMDGTQLQDLTSTP